MEADRKEVGHRAGVGTMNRQIGKLGLVVIVLIFSFTLAFGQTGAPASSGQAPAAAGQAQFDNRIFAELDKLIHVKRAKVGDVVTAHLTAPAKLRDGTEVPKGSKVVGSITEIKVKADNEGPSKLGLLFTSITLKDGKDIPVQMALVTVAPHTQQNNVDSLTAGNPFSGSDRLHAGTASAEMNQKTTEGEALSRGLGARAPAARTNVNANDLQPGKSYLPDVILASYSMGNPGTVLESKNSVYIDSGVRMMLLQP
jgi:hypothetical protein